MNFGHDDPTKLTPELVRDAVTAGDAIVTGGIYMTVRSATGERPGQATKLPAEISVTLQTPSFINGDITLETIVDGKTISTTPLPAAKRYEHRATITDGKWVVFHAKASGDLAPLHPGRKPFAVSNAMFLQK